MAKKIKYSDFSPGQRSCISGKIPILIKEGKDQDQAIAIAISMCTEKKEMAGKKDKCCENCEKGEPCCSGYSFQKNDDGSYTIFDVPIMAEVPKGEKGNARRIGPKWMKLAVRKANQRWEEDGYKAPLHVDHHGGKKNTEAAGFLLPKKVARMKYQGNSVWAIFADLQVRGDSFEGVRKNHFPYRSVEIFSWEKPEVNSLALLSDEVPYFRFDILRLGEEKKPVKKFGNREPVVACREFANGSAILFSFGGGQMATEEKIDKRQEEEQTAAFANENFESREERADVDRYEYEEGKKEGEEESKEEGDMSHRLCDVGPHLEAISAMLSKIASKLGMDEEEGEEEEEEDIEEVKESEKIHAPVEQSATMAALSGKVAALEARERKRLRSERETSLVENAMADLAEWHPDGSTRANMETLISTSTSPRETIEAFVSSYKTSVPKYPHATMEEFDASFGASDHPEVLKYATEGTDALALAREASAQYDDLERRGLVTASRDSFVSTQLNAAKGEIARR
tara:strand:- start:6852 stop:8393 length:1542 start_codon:yes stop_codon:yes gene_type:complete